TGVLWAAGRPLLAAAEAAAALALLALHLALRGRARMLTLAALVAVLAMAPQAYLVSQRPAGAVVHDGVQMTESAAARLLSGRDPYGHDYIDSAARGFYMPEVPVSFGLDHYVYMPGMILLDVPLRAAGAPGGSFAWMWLLGLPALALAAAGLGRGPGARVATTAAVALNPVLLVDYLYLFNDLFFIAPALGSFALLRRRRGVAAGILFGIACSLKQDAVLLAPFLALAAWRLLDKGGRLRMGAAAALAFAAVVVPFLVWNPAAFLGDVAGFFFGSGSSSYPIRGLGLPGLLLRAGAVPDRWGSFPAGELQAALALAVLAGAVISLRRWSWRRMWAWAAAEVLAVFLGGRVLAPNYLDLALVLACLAFASGLQDGLPVPRHEAVDGAAGDGGVEVPVRAGHGRDLDPGQGRARPPARGEVVQP
ncbi:MAG: glycosyltransferase 87 family protein, partial [Candidatus Dormibacterales bacterium]